MTCTSINLTKVKNKRKKNTVSKSRIEYSCLEVVAFKTSLTFLVPEFGILHNPPSTSGQDKQSIILMG